MPPLLSPSRFPLLAYVVGATLCSSTLATSCASRDDSAASQSNAESDAATDYQDAKTTEDALSSASDAAVADELSPPVQDASLDASVPDVLADAPQDIGPTTCSGAGARFITTVVEHHFGPGQDFGQADFPTPILGPPKGGGCCAGSLDVVSLGNGGSVTVAFDGNAIVDEPGADFIVFENAFHMGSASGPVFAELATVSVSDDGVSWHEFPCKATASPYGSCAGWHPVFANADNNAIDPTDPSVAGGDAFDLADVGLKLARFVRIVDREDISGANGVFDLDAIAIVHPACQ